MTKEKKIALWPVAEYRSVALLEKSGDKRTVWMGKEYRPDGNIYLAELDGDHIRLTQMPSELVIKYFLDERAEGKQPDFEGVKYLSFQEALKVAKIPPRPTPLFDFDEASGVFVRAD